MMKSLPKLAVCVGTAIVCYSPCAEADEVFSGVAGFSTVSVPASRDVYLSIPVAAGHPDIGKVSLIGTLDGDGNQRISIEGVDSLAENELSTAHVVRLLEGPDSGRRFAVVENDTNSLLVDFDGNAPSPGSVVALEEAWTLNSLLPPGSQTSLHESTGVFASGRRSELLVLSRTSTSGLAAVERIYFLEDGTWRMVGEENRDAGSDRLAGDAGLILRNPAGVSATTFSYAGTAYGGPMVSRLNTRSGDSGSNAIGFLGLGGRRLSDLAIGDAEVRPSPDFAPENRVDVLHIFSLVQPDSPAPAGSYFRNSGNWIDSDGNSNADDAIVPSGSVLVIENVSPAASAQNDWDQTGGTGN